MQLSHLNVYAHISNGHSYYYHTPAKVQKKYFILFTQTRCFSLVSLFLFQIVTMPLNPVSQAFMHQVALPVCVCVFVAETEVPNLTASER